MKRNILAIAALLLATVSWAQNLNPMVDVSNEYRSGFGGIEKSTIPMNVPDSLLQFNKDFDYSTFDNPFRGSYEFVPYSVQLKPERGEYGARRLWLCAGAGYTVRPVLKAVYTPALKKDNVTLNIFQDGGGYLGEYYNLGNGMDFTEKLGFDVHTAGKEADFRAQIYYGGIYAGLKGSENFSHMGNAEISLKSVTPKKLRYDLGVSYRFALLPGAVDEHSISVDGVFEPILGKSFRTPVDVAAQMNSGNFNVEAAPHIQLMVGPVVLRAGARFSFLTFQRVSEDPYTKFRIVPDISANIDFAKGTVSLYGVLTGGSRLYSASQMLEHNHFMTPEAAYSVEKFHAYGGLRGYVGSHVQYDVSGGFNSIGNAPLDYMISGIMGCSFNLVHADAAFIWRSERVDVDANAHFKKMAFNGERPTLVCSLPAVAGDIRVIYNWQKKLYAGIYALVSTSRSYLTGDAEDQVPGYVNLGVNVRYRLSHKLSVWVQGSNLLNSEIYRIPLVAEKGISGMAGITLNL